MRIHFLQQLTSFIAGVCTAAPPHCSRAGPRTPIVLRCSGGRAASKEPSQGDSCGTEDFHPCNPRHQSSWAHWALGTALGTARLRHTRLVVMGTFSRDTRCSTASPAGHWATRREWCWQYYLQLSLEYCFGLLQPYKQQFNFHNHPSANSHITDFVKDKISSQLVEWLGGFSVISCTITISTCAIIGLQ